MKVTFKDVLVEAMKQDKFEVISVNRSLMEVAKSTKKRSGFVKVAVYDELASDLISQKKVAFMIHMDGDELNKIVGDLERSESVGDN